MKYFGTDGIRQEAEKFTPEFLAAIVKGLVDYAGDNIKIFLAGDTRESTEWIIQDLATACETFGLEYSLAGVLPTPAIIYCFYEMGFDFAIDVTASHNPHTDNGIKILERSKTYGKKLSEKGRQTIEKALQSEISFNPISPTIREDLHTEALEIYKKHLKDYIGPVNFKNLHIGMDCANGATSVVNKSIFKEFGATVDLINCCENYNTNINKNCGSTHLEALQELVTTKHLDFGVAFDGDGDRCLAIDSEGHEVDGDKMLAFLSQYLGLDSIVTTVMANQGLLNWAKDNNIHTEISPIGDANVVNTMLEKNIKIGSEQNGHVILPDHTSGDGMLAALMIAKAVTKTHESLQDLASIITIFPQIIVNMPATSEQKTSFKEKPEVKKLLLDYNQKLESIDGRLLVRPSGTENLIRITMWGKSKKEIENLAKELKNKLKDII